MSEVERESKGDSVAFGDLAQAEGSNWIRQRQHHLILHFTNFTFSLLRRGSPVPPELEKQVRWRNEDPRHANEVAKQLRA